MTESQYTQSIHRGLPKHVHAWKISARYANGVPDAWYSGLSGDLWVEYKYVKKMTKKVTPKLSALQRKWLNQRYEEGRDVAVVVGSPEGAIILIDGEWNSATETAGVKLRTKKDVARFIEARVA